MLRITFLDVGNGDSMVLEHHTANGIRYAVLDSNKYRDGSVPRALEFLTAAGAQELAFVGLTHPHRDHLSGLDEILAYFGRNARRVLMYPLPRDPARQEAVVRQFIAVARQTDGSQRNFAAQFLRFLQAIKDHALEYEDLSGFESQIFCDEFTDGAMTMHAVLPPNSHKGPYFDDIGKGQMRFGDPAQNDLSFALKICYAGKTVLLGGDASLKSWRERSRRTRQVLNAVVAKLPHHGSGEDCSPEVIDQIFGPGSDEPRYAIISANGRKHPHPTVLKSLKDRKILPFCTGRATTCGASPVRDLFTDPKVDPALVRFVNTHTAESSRNGACQGDITLEIKADGTISVVPAYRTPCGFRGA